MWRKCSEALPPDKVHEGRTATKPLTPPQIPLNRAVSTPVSPFAVRSGRPRGAAGTSKSPAGIGVQGREDDGTASRRLVVLGGDTPSGGCCRVGLLRDESKNAGGDTQTGEKSQVPSRFIEPDADGLRDQPHACAYGA